MRTVVIAVQRWQLMVVTGGGSPEPAGHRLERGDPLPIDKFVFDDAGEAKRAEERLQKYIDRTHQS